MNTNNNNWFYNSKEFQEFFRHSRRSTVIKANAPDFTIVAVSDTYLSLTHRKREELLDRNFFDIFPGNAVTAAQQTSLLQSFERVIQNKTSDELPVYEYQIFLPDQSAYTTLYWSNLNEPVFDDEGCVAYIIRTVTNVSDKVLAEHVAEEKDNLKDFLQREQALNEELAATNEELRAVNEELSLSQEQLFSLTNELERQVEKRTRQVQASEARFRSLIEQIPAAINVFLTEDPIVDLANQRMLEIWGRTFDEVNGKPLDVVMPELKGQPFMQKLRDVIATGIPYISSAEKAFIQRNGKLKELYFDIIYQPVINPDGTVTSCLQIASDVTEAVFARQRIQALNEELTAANEELSSSNEELLQSQADYTGIYNELLANGDDLRFTIEAASLATFDLNPVTGRFTGNDLLKSWFGLLPEEEIELQKATDVIAKEDRERVIKAIGEALLFSSGGNYDIEYAIDNLNYPMPRIVRAKGKTVFNENQQPIRLRGILQDITEQKKDEQRKNDFIGMVSHEMKTPLTSLSGFLQLLQVKTDQENAFANNMLGKANRQISKMTTLINGFLNVARLESGKIYINKQHFDMAVLVKEAEEEAASLYNTHRIVFAPVEETFVNADKDKIGQVISNLISNAVKYSPSNTLVNVACVTHDGMAVVSVKDEGMGIKEEDQPKLFDRYYRVNHDHTSSPSGFGIGLYLCAEIIQRHDGKIWVESEVGKGSTFLFSLPVVA